MEKYILFAIFSFLVMESFGQPEIPGQVSKAAIPAVNALDPDGDGWTTTSGTQFVSDEVSESELPWVALYQCEPEPGADTRISGPCTRPDIQDDDSLGKRHAYWFYDDPDGIADNGDDRMFFRLRVAKKVGDGSFGYSVVMDTDKLWGTTGPNADPNAVPGNPGFEVEIKVDNDDSLTVADVDGTTTPTVLVTRGRLEQTQQSFALKTTDTCSIKVPAFFDFWILLSDIGILSTDSIRIATATTNDGTSVLGINLADIGGYDDRKGTPDEGWDCVISGQNPSPLEELPVMFLLPVKLTSFNSHAKIDEVMLQWTTYQEINNDRFEIERSKDATQFSKIGSVKGNGNSMEMIQYTFVDKATALGVNYYRLKQIDLDGKFNYSKIIVSDLSNYNEDPHIYPIPFEGDKITIITNRMDISEAQVSIINSIGDIVLVEDVEFKYSEGELHSSKLLNLTSGYYFISIKTKLYNSISKFIVR